MNDCMTFPDTVEEFMEQYKVVDTEHIYTNGSEFVPIFRMKQWFEHLPSVQPDTTTNDSIPVETGKNDGDGTSGDCISRTQAIDALRGYLVEKRCPDDGTLTCRLIENEVINKLPSVQQEIIRCKDCKHWNPQLKTANGNGLGSCDFHNVALVTSEGFCYWAEKRGETE